MTSQARHLPKLWLSVFSVEVLVCFSTVAFWVLAPGSFLADMYGIDSLGGYYLLQQSAVPVFTIYVYMYIRLLRQADFPWRPFNYLQEAMAIGDVWLIGLAVAMRVHLGAALDLCIAQGFMATLWLTIRMVYLVRVGWPSARVPTQEPQIASPFH